MWHSFVDTYTKQADFFFKVSINFDVAWSCELQDLLCCRHTVPLVTCCIFYIQTSHLYKFGDNFAKQITHNKYFAYKHYISLKAGIKSKLFSRLRGWRCGSQNGLICFPIFHWKWLNKWTKVSHGMLKISTTL